MSEGFEHDNRLEYERRIHRVMAYIDSHLDEPLSLETLAAVANFSAFHFHRVFLAFTGETLGDFLRRRRVETGALRLMTQPRLTVLQAALAVGFGSGEAFARAFKLRFNQSPSAWRRTQRNRNSGLVKSNSDQDALLARLDHEVPATSRSDLMAKPDVFMIDMPATPVAYYRYTGPYGPPVSRFWMEQVAPWMAENDLFGQVRFGIAHDDPTITDPARCRYDACVAIEPARTVSGQPLRTTLPGGRYACTPFEGTVEDIDAAWNRLLSHWMPDSGLQLDARPLLEHYPVDATFDAKTGIFSCNLCVPVMPLR